MKPKHALILAIVGALALAGGWYVNRTSSPGQAEMTAGTLMFPNLAPSLQGVARVEITSKGKTLAIARNGEVWGLENQAGYPVQQGKLRELLTGLTELRVIEPRTSDPEQFGRLGLADPDKAEGGATLLRALDGAGKPVVELLTGIRRARTQGGLPEAIYVRRPGENRTWLAEGRLAPETDSSTWLDRDIMNIPDKRISSVTVTRGAEVLEFGRAEDKFLLRKPTAAGTVDGFKLDEVARALQDLTFQEVKPAKDIPGTKIGTGQFVTDDGLTVIATVFRDDENIWATLDASAGETAQAEADRLAGRVKGWAYQLSAWKEKMLVPSLEDLRPPKPPSENAPTPAETSPKQ